MCKFDGCITDLQSMELLKDFSLSRRRLFIHTNVNERHNGCSLAWEFLLAGSTKSGYVT